MGRGKRQEKKNQKNADKVQIRIKIRIKTGRQRTGRWKAKTHGTETIWQRASENRLIHTLLS